MLRGGIVDLNQLTLFPDLNLRADWHDDVLRLLRAADVGIEDLKLVSPDEKDPRRVGILVRHKGGDEIRGWLPLELESSGTITLLNLAVPLLRTLRIGGILCIDELEASLHPSVALQLVRLFGDPEHNPAGGQLLFTTHDTNLLGREVSDEPVLRRDQIWFTEKDEEGATHLYPLTDFRPRKSENLERGYLQGRYGAVPYLGDFAERVVPRTTTNATQKVAGLSAKPNE